MDKKCAVLLSLDSSFILQNDLFFIYHKVDKDKIDNHINTRDTINSILLLHHLDLNYLLHILTNKHYYLSKDSNDILHKLRLFIYYNLHILQGVTLEDPDNVADTIYNVMLGQFVMDKTDKLVKLIKDLIRAIGILSITYKVIETEEDIFMYNNIIKDIKLGDLVYTIKIPFKDIRNRYYK